MKGDRIVRFFMPKEERFHELLERDTTHLLASARVFMEAARAQTLEDRKVKVAQLQAMEKEGDKITADIFAALNSTFITPLDREDIRSLASDLDDILDYLEGVGQYLVMFEISDSPESLRRFAEILVSMAEEIHTLSSLIWDMGNEKKMHERIVRISGLENEADAIYFGVLGELFREGNGRTPVEILKWKEVFQGLEDACDQCKEFTHVVGNVLVKNA